MLELLNVQNSTLNSDVFVLLYALLLAFILSTLIAVTYEKTYRALSYSRNYVQTLILISIVSTMVMQAVGDSLARGLGIMAAMAVIRFRTNFKDARDIVFIFAALAVGVSCGVNGFAIAIVGTFVFLLAAWVLYISPLGNSSFFDGMLRFSLETNPSYQEELKQVLARYCKTFALISLREMTQGKRLEYAYQIKLKKGVDRDEFMRKLGEIPSISGTHFMMQEATVEL